MSEFREFSRPPIPEWPDVAELMDKLEKNLNWENGKNYGLVEHLLLENFIHDRFFEQKFNELNELVLRDLTEAEKREVLDHIKDLLRNASEELLLEYLKYGIELTVKRSEKRTFRLIDYENPEKNSFIYAREIKYPGSPDNIKPDFTLFVNGIPIAIIEVKPSTRIGSEEEAIEQIRRYEQESPELFRYVQLAVVYGHRKLFLPTYPNWRRDTRLTPPQVWKIEKKQGDKLVKIECIDDLLRPKTLLNIIRWFTFFREREGKRDKIIGRYNQYIATEKALQRINGYLSGGQKQNGLIWHWQGSGKTYIMFFIANKFFEEYFERNPIIFFIVDRIDLQTQLRDFLRELKVPKFKSYLKTIENIERLKEEITEIKRAEYRQNIITRGIYITLIQKFRKEEFEDLLLSLANEQLEYLKEKNREEYERIQEQLSRLPEEERKRKLIELGSIGKKEILLLIDEAHRSQYGLLASMLKNVFPNAIRFAFTGTPVFKFERNTFLEFAYPPQEWYLDVYFIRDSIADGFTLPIVYDVIQEGKLTEEGIKILLDDEDVKKYLEYWLEASEEGSAADDIEAILETGESPETTLSQTPLITRSEIRRHLTKIRVFLTNEKRLEKLAQYIAERLEEDTERFRYKAMVVTANREACVRMKRFLDRELERLYAQRYGEDVKKWTEIVMTYQHNDRGVILEYREELTRRRGKRDTKEINLDIQREFKEKETPKILIVTDMLITGFDAPRLKVMYLDKPLYEHRLLQATARVNRPYKDEVSEKKYGLIVDSVGLLKYLRQSIRKFELIVNKEIAADLEENALGMIQKRLEEFKENLETLKQIMKTLIIRGRDLSIDLEKIKAELRTNKIKALETIKGIVDPKTRLIAAFWITPEVQSLLNLMRETINLFRALGSHKEKIHYVEEVELISYIYGRILNYIKGNKVPREFWEGLIELIHEKTLIEEFQTLVRTKIDNEMLKGALRKFRDKISANKVIMEEEVAGAYNLLRSLLEMDPANPVYRTIYEKIERAREEWLSRNIDAVMFLQNLLDASEQKIKYDEEISSKPLVERVVDTISFLIARQFAGGKEISLKLEELRKVLSEIIKAPKIVTYHENKLRTALMKDLFREAREIGANVADARELKNFAETVTREYVLDEIEKARKSGRTVT